MAKYIATIDVLIDVPDDEPHKDGYACDAIAEALRPLLKTYADNPEDTAWIDWRYHGDSIGQTWPMPEEHNGEGFELAEKGIES